MLLLFTILAAIALLQQHLSQQDGSGSRDFHFFFPHRASTARNDGAFFFCLSSVNIADRVIAFTTT